MHNIYLSLGLPTIFIRFNPDDFKVNNNNLDEEINNIKLWPGGKEKADTILNSIGDQFYGLLGWLFTFFIIKN